MANGLKRDKAGATAGLHGGVGGKGKGSVRDQIQRKGAVEGLRKLCPDRSTRDRRTIEEIARDIKAKKDGSAPASQTPLPRDQGRRLSPPKGIRPVASFNGSGGGGVKISKPSGTDKVPLPRRDDPRLIPPSSARKRQPSISSSSSTSSTSPPPSKKRYASRLSPPLRLNDKSSAAAVSAEIQALFRRPGRPPPSRKSGYDDDLSDGSSDMEAGLSDVELEESRAARIARKEDEAAEREERERKARKEALKKQKMRG